MGNDIVPGCKCACEQGKPLDTVSPDTIEAIATFVDSEGGSDPALLVQDCFIEERPLSVQPYQEQTEDVLASVSSEPALPEEPPSKPPRQPPSTQPSESKMKWLKAHPVMSVEATATEIERLRLFEEKLTALEVQIGNMKDYRPQTRIQV